MGIALAALALAALQGCVFFGLLKQAPMVRVENVPVSLPPGIGSAALVSRAALACKMTPLVVSSDVVRCSAGTSRWNMSVDVHFSGGYFSIEYVSSEGMWYDPDACTIHSGYNSRVESLRRMIMKEAARMAAQPAAVAVTPGAAAAPAAVAVAPAEKPYKVESFKRENGAAFAYSFDLALSQSAQVDLSLNRLIQADLRESVRSEYVSATGGAGDRNAMRIDFPEYAIADGHVRGRVVVLTVQLQEFVYDSNSKQGRLAVKVDPRQYEAVRQWVRNNIATLAKDKDASIFQAISIAPRFTIGREVLRDDGVLEVEFHTGGN